jgi:transcriptional regulator with XRE-family HTH domain
LKSIVAANLVIGREAKGLLLREVAALMGGSVTPDQVWRWEDGRHLPSAAYQQKLADIYFDGNLARLYENVTAGERANGNAHGERSRTESRTTPRVRD